LTFLSLSDLVEEISKLGLVDALQEYHKKPLEREGKSIVAGPSFLQYFKLKYQLETSSNLNLAIPAGTMCCRQLEPGMR
jgi:hypothetical protein